MKIHIKSEGKNLRLYLPTGLLFSKTVARLGCKYGQRYAGDAVKGLSPEAMEALFAEFRSIKRKFKKWELVDIENTDGSFVRIIL